MWWREAIIELFEEKKGGISDQNVFTQKKSCGAQEALCLTWRESLGFFGDLHWWTTTGWRSAKLCIKGWVPEIERSVEVHRCDESRTKSRWPREVGLVKRRN